MARVVSFFNRPYQNCPTRCCDLAAFIPDNFIYEKRVDLRLISTWAREEHQNLGALRVRKTHSSMGQLSCLLVRAVEEVVRRVSLELSLTHRQAVVGADPPWCLTLYEGALARNLPPVGPCWFPTDCNKRQGIAPLFGQLGSVPATTMFSSAGLCPHLAAIERTLPGRVATEGHGVGGVRVGVSIDTGEVGDDLDVLAEELHKEGGFGTGGIDGPGSATGVWVGQANVALSTEGMADHVCSVPLRWRNAGRSRRRRDVLRHRGCDCAEGTCEHESGYEQIPNSRIFFVC